MMIRPNKATLQYSVSSDDGKDIFLRSKVITTFLIYTFLFGCYTSISIYADGQLLVPSVISVLAAVLYILYQRRFVRARILFSLMMLVVFLSIQLWYNTLYYDAVASEFGRGAGNLVYSIVLCLVGFRMMTSVSGSSLSRCLWVAILFLVIGCFAEQYLGLKFMSDTFREIVYPRSLYVADDRDIELFGAIRPKVFSLEPSFVGLWFTILCAAWIGLAGPARFWRRVIIAVTLAGVMSFLLRSSTIVFLIPLTLTAYFASHSRNRSASSVKRTLIIAPAALVILGSCLAGQLMPLAGPAFLSGDSVYGRIVAPPLVAQQAIAERPIFGVGIANQQKLLNLTLPFYQGRAQYTGSAFAQESARSLITNSFFFQFIYFGIIGSLFLLLFYVFLLRAIDVQSTSFVLGSTFISWFTIGGYVSVQVWAMFFLFAAVAWHAERVNAVWVIAPPPVDAPETTGDKAE